MRAFLLALAAALLLAAPAQAAITGSNISSPADPSFPANTGGTTMSVSGTTDGGLGDHVDIVCTYGPSDTLVSTPAGGYANVPVQTGGSFSTTVNLDEIQSTTCRLHAVPSGTTPGSYAAFTGPRVGVAIPDLPAIAHGWFYYQLFLHPLGGSAGLTDVDDCGVANMSPVDPGTLAVSQQVFGCTGQLSTGFTLPRSEIQVDGVDTYTPSFRYDQGSTAYPDDPPPVLSEDAATGLGSVASQQTLTVCSPGGVYPPSMSTNCAGYAPAGVRLDHTAALVQGGAMATTRDTFVSTDGRAHDLDLLFGDETAFTSPTWRFPGESAFAAKTDGDSVTGLPAGPGSALVNGEAEGSFGVIAWSSPPSAANFNGPNSFEAHHVVHVPAGGSTTLAYAYGTAVTLDGINALVPAAIAAVTLPPATPGGGAPPPTGSGTSKLKLELGRVKVAGDGTVTVFVNAPAAGSIAASETAVVPRSAGKKRTKKLVVSRARRSVARAGQVKLVLRLNSKGRKIFRARHRLPVTLSVTYKPASGSGNQLSKHLTLKLKKQRHKH